MRRVDGRRLHYQFLENAKGWREMASFPEELESTWGGGLVRPLGLVYPSRLATWATWNDFVSWCSMLQQQFCCLSVAWCEFSSRWWLPNQKRSHPFRVKKNGAGGAPWISNICSDIVHKLAFLFCTKGLGLVELHGRARTLSGFARDFMTIFLRQDFLLPAKRDFAYFLVSSHE